MINNNKENTNNLNSTIGDPKVSEKKEKNIVKSKLVEAVEYYYNTEVSSKMYILEFFSCQKSLLKI